jgi:hypothetical protein
MGAATPNITYSYTNSSDVTGRGLVPFIARGITAAVTGQIVHAGSASATVSSPFLPLNAGDTGVKSVQTVALSASYVSGSLALAFCRPLATIALPTIGVTSERDFVHQIPSMPKLEDGACLNLLYYAGAATPTGRVYQGTFMWGWG